MKNLHNLFLAVLVTASPALFGQTCSPGLDNITVNPGNVTAQTWETQGNEIHGTMVIVDKIGIVTEIGIIAGYSGPPSKGALYSNINGAPGELVSTTPIYDPVAGFLQLDTFYVSLDTPIAVAFGDTLWPCVKHSGNNNFNLLFNDPGVGLRFEYGDPYANAFPPDFPMQVITQTGSYGIFLVIEDCVSPVFGCMDAGACNYDPLANVSQGCEYASCVGCMDEGACNFDPEALIDGGCVYLNNPFRDCQNNCWNDADGDNVCDEEEVAGCMDSTAVNFDPFATDPVLFGEPGACWWNIGGCDAGDFDGDLMVAVPDLLDMLCMYGVAIPYGDKRDLTGDGQVNAGDLLDLLACIGHIVE